MRDETDAAHAVGMDDYIVQPISIDTLGQCLGSVWRNPKDTRSPRDVSASRARGRRAGPDFA